MNTKPTSSLSYYQYGAVPARIAPAEAEDRALTQLRLARRLWNLLAAIERVRIKSYQRIICDEVQEQIDQFGERNSDHQRT